MTKNLHEVCDPVHGFIVFDDFEKSLIDTPPVQRLRDIHQLALEFMVYPGATHKRFEHSLGVMHLAGQIFDSLFVEEHLAPMVRERLEEIIGAGNAKNKDYWRRVVRLAGLLHDIGHPMFSHTAEGLFPEGFTHEHMTERLLKSLYLLEKLNKEHGHLADDILECSIDFKKRTNVTLPPWKTLLNEIITSDVFGADRMDYLLRDSMYTGVAYGHFDKDRLISCMRVGLNDVDAPVLGVERGGLHSAESLLVARYFMHENVYYHKIKKIYDKHLEKFLKSCLGEKGLPTDTDDFLRLSDSYYIDEMRRACLDSSHRLNDLAKCILGRGHFRHCYTLTKAVKDPDIFEKLNEQLIDKLGKENVESFRTKPKEDEIDFPLVDEDGRSTPAKRESVLLQNLPQPDVGYLYCPADMVAQASGIIQSMRDGSSIAQKGGDKDGS